MPQRLLGVFSSCERENSHRSAAIDNLGTHRQRQLRMTYKRLTAVKTIYAHRNASVTAFYHHIG